MNTTTTRPRLGLKPAERERAQIKGLLGGGIVDAPQAAASLATAPPVHRPRPAPNAAASADLARSGRPATPAEPRPTLLQLLYRDLGVTWLKFPLAVGAGKDRPRDVRQRIGVLTRRRHYLVALARSPVRFNVDGTVSGPVSDEHREHAKAQLVKLEAKPADNAHKEKLK